MTLPTDKVSFEQLAAERPNDAIYQKVKHRLAGIAEESSKLKDTIIDVILDDIVFDHALASALDEIGEILEYQAQQEGIERPDFTGDALLSSSNRLSRIRFVTSLSEVLSLSEEAAAQVLTAEIERLWFTGGRGDKDKKQLHTLKLPEEVVSILRDIGRGKRHGGHSGTASVPNRADSGRAKGKPAPAARPGKRT